MPHLEIDTVSRIIRDVARTEVMPAFNALAAHQVRKKSSGEIVTEIDLIVERLLTERLTDHIPGSEALGEESYDDDSSLLNLTKAQGPVWIIDPIDGTKNYTKGNPHFAIIVAYRNGGKTIASWIYDPIRDVMISAQTGQGAWMGSERLRVKGIGKTITELRGSLGHKLTKSYNNIAASNARPIPALSDRLRCCGQEYMALATGDIQFLQYGMQLKPWDHSAGISIATEAGYYAAFMEDESRYDVTLGIPTGYLMIAPNRHLWLSLRDLLWQGT